MKLGDLVYCKGGLPEYDRTGIVLKDNQERGTVKIYDIKSQVVKWVVRSACKCLTSTKR